MQVSGLIDRANRPGAGAGQPRDTAFDIDDEPNIGLRSRVSLPSVV